MRTGITTDHASQTARAVQMGMLRATPFLQRLAIVPLALVLAATPAFAGLQLRVSDGKLSTVQSAASKPAASQPDSPVVLVPSQGRPTFCIPGEPFSCLLHLSAQIGEAPRFSLQNALFPQLRYPLLQVGGLRMLGEGYARVQLSAPTGTPPSLYNLVVAGAVRETTALRSVSVIAGYKTSFRFVHLSNMNIGDPAAMQFDPHLPEEVNTLAPEFIIATGDYTEWARLADNPTDWQSILEYMARFQAPVYMLCGDHDHEASFTRYVANSLIGTIDYGQYHGLLLLDHGYHPIEQDDEQIRWIVDDLAASRDRTFSFIVTHSDEMGLVRHLKEMKLAEQVFHDGKVKMLISGGHTDWDYSEFASVVAGLPGLNFIRTAQSSTAVCDKASGVPHYRVIEVTNDRISYVCPDETLNPRLQNSVPSGRILTTFDGPDDGSQEVVTANIANALPRPWSDCRIWLHVRKGKKETPPAVTGGTLIQYLDLGTSWAVLAGFELPDKGSVTLQAGPPEQLVPAPPVFLELVCSPQLSFTARQAGFGLTYYTCPSPVVLRIANRTKHAAKVWPIVRLNGTNLQVSSPEPLPMTVKAMSTSLLRVGLTQGQLALGPHMLQTYLLDDPLRRLTTQRVVLLPEASQAPGPPPTTQPASQPAASSQPAESQSKGTSSD